MNVIIERFKKYRKGGILLFKYGGKGKVSSNGQYPIEDYRGFSGDVYQAAYGALKNLHLPNLNHNRIINLSRWIAMHKAYESGYGSHISNNFNYGGYGGAKNPIKFKSMNDYITRYVNDAVRLYPGIFNANSYQDYIKALFPKERGYNPRDKNGNIVDDINLYDPNISYNIYWNQAKGMEKRVNNSIDEWIDLGYNLQ